MPKEIQRDWQECLCPCLFVSAGGGAQSYSANSKEIRLVEVTTCRLAICLSQWHFISMEELFRVFCKPIICALHSQHCSWYRCNYTWQKFGVAIHKCSHWGKHTIHCHTRPYLSSYEHPKLKMLQRCVIDFFDHLTNLILEKHEVDWNYKIAFEMSKFFQSYRENFQIKHDSSLQLAHKEQRKGSLTFGSSST